MNEKEVYIVNYWNQEQSSTTYVYYLHSIALHSFTMPSPLKL